MKRRTILAAAAGATLTLRSARAQRRARPIRLGFLSGGPPGDTALIQIQAGLTRIGWIEGRDYTMNTRFAEFASARLPILVDELLRDGIDILLTAGPSASVVPIAQHSVPVVFVFSGDPVVAGLVQSLARPGGNATGLTQMSYELVGKRLELLREVTPGARRTAVLQSPLHPGERGEREAAQVSTDRLGIELVVYAVRDRAEVVAALAASAEARCDSLLCFLDPVTLANREVIAVHARAQRIASVAGHRDFCEAGGLMSYGPSRAALYARTAYFVERIAGGVRAGELPVEQPTVIETIVNARTAAAIGVTLPPTILVRADEVIE